MVKRVSLAAVSCPVGRALDAIGDWWSLLIVRDAFDGLRRFSELQKNLGIAKGILTTRLRHLVDLGVLETMPASDGSAYQDYVLTKKGRDLFLVVVSLRQWGEDYCFKRDEPHSALVDTTSGRPVGRLELHARDGRALTSSDTTVRKLDPRTRGAKAARPSR